MKRLLAALPLLIVLAFLSPAPAYADIAVDVSSACTSSSDQATFTCTLTLTDADALYAWGMCLDYGTIGMTPTLSSATWNGDAMTEILADDFDDGVGENPVSLTRILAPDLGSSLTLSYTWDANCTYGHLLGYLALSGVDQATPNRTPNSGDDTSTPATVTFTSEAGDLVFGIVSFSASGSDCSAGAGETEQFDIDGAGDYICGFTETAGGTTTVINPTVTGVWIMSGAAVIPAASIALPLRSFIVR